jgi:hypothetical protein
MHCARLGSQGIELLTTRRLELPIGGEPAEWLRAVRRGDGAFGERWERVLAVDASSDGWRASSRFPNAVTRPGSKRGRCRPTSTSAIGNPPDPGATAAVAIVHPFVHSRWMDRFRRTQWTPRPS